ncbi:diguanylate cyclase [Parafrankia sp. EAN1pec]|uniref:GGDEF domain-containing protein n=1 Tax=Parafrankia sp. (strain EAN1pec) TaxID=298653 RepID=UPI0000543A0F|nr:diguanylate cyclase [Frankia sp. EAN1pec]
MPLRQAPWRPGRGHVPPGLGAVVRAVRRAAARRPAGLVAVIGTSPDGTRRPAELPATHPAPAPIPTRPAPARVAPARAEPLPMPAFGRVAPTTTGPRGWAARQGLVHPFPALPSLPAGPPTAIASAAVPRDTPFPEVTGVPRADPGHGTSVGHGASLFLRDATCPASALPGPDNTPGRTPGRGGAGRRSRNEPRPRARPRFLPRLPMPPPPRGSLRPPRWRRPGGAAGLPRPPAELIGILAVEALFLFAAVVLVANAAADRSPPRPAEFATFAAFTALAVVTGVLLTSPAAAGAGQRAEGATAAPQDSGPPMTSTWTLPVALLLPPLYALLAHVPLWLATGGAGRLGRPAGRGGSPPPARIRLHDTAALGLAGAAAAAVHHLIAPTTDPRSAERLAGSSHTFAALIAAVGVYVLVDRLLRPGHWSGGREQAVAVAVETGAALILAVLWAASPLLLVVAAPLVLLLRRGLAHAELLTAARTDPKTRLATMAYWRQVAQRETTRTRRLGRPLSVLLVDVDHFKQVNDRHGHLNGDAVLLAVADALRLATRPQDLVGRFGGEEFVVLLAEVDLDAAAAVAERVRHQVAGASTRLGRAEVTVTVSVGVACTSPARPDPLAHQASPAGPADGTDAAGHGAPGTATEPAFPGPRAAAPATDDLAILTDLLERADAALYQAKREGRNRVRTAGTATAGGAPPRPAR